MQVQHQLIVTKAETADVYVFDGTEGPLLVVAAARDLAADSRRLGRIHALRTRRSGAAAAAIAHRVPHERPIGNAGGNRGRASVVFHGELAHGALVMKLGRALAVEHAPALAANASEAAISSSVPMLAIQ